jgi:hypothetical protein
MTASDLVVALRPVADALDGLGISYYIGGSLASSTHGIARSSLDTDIVVVLEPHHVDPLIARLGSAYIPVDRLRAAAANKSSCNLIHLATMFRERQWWNVIGVLKVNSDVDRSYLREWAGTLGVADLLERALTDANR